MAQIGIFYGSTTGKTRIAAEAIQAEFGPGKAEIFDIAGAGSANLSRYSLLILGASTWGIGDLQDDWDTRLNLLEEVDFSGKKVAFFGLGDALGYPESFLDAMGALYHAVKARGADCIGRWPSDGYAFSFSAAVIDEEFVGLGLDEDNQAHLSGERISQWVAQLEREAGF